MEIPSMLKTATNLFRERQWALLVALVSIGFLVYANSLPNQFVWDDEGQIVNNPLLQQFKNLPEIVTSSTFYTGSGLEGPFYRPIVSLYYFLNYHFWGLQPWVFHLVQIVFHLFNSVLIFYLIRNILVLIPIGISHFDQATEVAFLTALLFVIHPVNVETVAYIGSIGDVLYTTFLLIALLLFLKGVIHQEKRVKEVYLWSVIILVFCGLLTKEHAIVLFAVIALYFFLFVRPTLMVWIKFGLGTAAVIGLYISLRHFVAEIPLIRPRNTVGVCPIGKADFITRMLTVPYEILIQLKTIFFPLKLTVCNNFVVGSPGDKRFWGSLLIIVFFGLFLTWLIKHSAKHRSKIFLFFLGWFFIGLLPILNVIPLDMTVAERWLYFPQIGLLTFLSILIIQLLQNIHGIWRVATLYFVLFLIIGALSVRTIIRNKDWREGLTLFGHDIKYFDQGNASLELSYGVELARIGQLEEAEKHLKKSIMLDDSDPVPHDNLGALYEKKGELEKAKAEYQKCLEITDHVITYQNFAVLLLKNGQKKEAKIVLETGIKKFSRNSSLALLLAALYYEEKETDKAIDLLEVIFQNEPHNIQARQFYSIIKQYKDLKVQFK